MNGFITIALTGSAALLAFLMLTSSEITDNSSDDPFLFPVPIFALENGTHYNTSEGTDLAENEGSFEQAVSIHDIETPIIGDSLELTISNNTVPRNSTFPIKATVMAHRTGNVETLWELELQLPAGYDITYSSAASVQNTTSHAHGKSMVNWEAISPPTPSEHPEILSVTASAYDVETGMLLRDSPITIQVEILTINTDPLAMDDNFSTSEDTPLDLPILQNDLDPDGDDLTVSEIVEGPGHGAVVLSANSTLISYLPNTDFFGTDIFTYMVRDTYNGTSSAMVSVNVIPINDPPIAVDDHVIVSEDTQIDIDVLENDYDPDIDANVNGDHRPLYLVAVYSPTNGTAVLIEDAASRNSTVIRYLPSGNFTGNDAFSYVISDGYLNNTGHVTVLVEPVNDAPGARSESFSTIENRGLDIALNGCDPDGDQLSFKLVAGPTNGTLDPIAVTGLASANTHYTPKSGYHGTDSFAFLTSDGTLESLIATISIQIIPSNSTGDSDNNGNGGGTRGRNGSVYTGGATITDPPQLPTNEENDTAGSYDNLSLAGYEMLDEQGNKITCVDEGKTATFSYEILNKSLLDYDCLIIWQLTDGDDITRDIRVNRVFMPRFESMTYDDVHWVGGQLGKYEVRLFIWTNLESPLALAVPLRHEFTVENAPTEGV